MLTFQTNHVVANPMIATIGATSFLKPTCTDVREGKVHARSEAVGALHWLPGHMRAPDLLRERTWANSGRRMRGGMLAVRRSLGSKFGW